MKTQTTNGANAETDGAAPSGAAELSAGSGSVEQVVQRLVALLENHENATRPDPAALDDLAAAARRTGLGAWRERALLAGGTAELLITADRHGIDRDGAVAVVVADHGASDALRGRLRRLGAHREIAAVVVATTRPRHEALSTEVRQVPVHVVVLDGDHWQPRYRASARTAGTSAERGPG